MWSGNELLQWLDIDHKWAVTIEAYVGYIKVWGLNINDSFRLRGVSTANVKELVEEAYCYQS